MGPRVPFGPHRRARRPRRARSHPRSLLLATALLALPFPAAADITTLEVTAPSETVPHATLQIFDLQQPDRIVEERKVESEGNVQVDLESGRSYGVRVKGGPVLVERFEAGDEVRLAIPRAFAKSVHGWTVSGGFGFGWDGRDAKGDIVFGNVAGAIMSSDGEKHIGSGAGTGDLEFMAPPCEALPGSPRVFFYIAAIGTSAADTLASDAVDDGLLLVPNKLSVDLHAKTKENWSVGLGAQFSLPIGAAEIRVKPAVGYGQQRYSLRATLNEQTIAGIPINLVTTSRKNHTVHFVRPKLSIEIPVARMGTMEVSAFVSGGASIRVGGATKRLHLDGVVISADYRFQPDLVGFGLGAGLRFSWSPLFLR